MIFIHSEGTAQTSDAHPTQALVGGAGGAAGCTHRGGELRRNGRGGGEFHGLPVEIHRQLDRFGMQKQAFMTAIRTEGLVALVMSICPVT